MNRKHEKIHLNEDERPCLCDKCKRRFAYAKDLSRHQRSKHSKGLDGQKRSRQPAEAHADLCSSEPAQKYLKGWEYCTESQCSFATKGFARKDKFKEHMIKKHNIRPEN